MPVSVRCSCNKSLTIADRLAGKTVKCPACGAPVSVPDGPGFEVVEDEVPSPPAMARARPVSRPSQVSADDETEDDDKPRRLRDEDDEDELPKRKKRKRSRSSDSDGRWGPRDKIYDDDNYSKPFNQRWTNPGVAGGICAMIGAVVWFVLGIILLDRIFFYPPILFIIGLGSFLRGLGLFGHAGD